MISTYKNEDVKILLKDISGLVIPMDTGEREKRIQSGVHYCEMLPLEYKPTEKYIELYNEALKNYAQSTADAVAIVSEKIYELKGKELAVVSLARAGIPIGVLIKRYIKNKYNTELSHYAISIIRGRGIDDNAMKYIINRHNEKSIQFVDGWVGKGAIFRELEKVLNKYANIDKSLAVLSDPANITDLCGTHEDILIPSSCLNSTITGLISRTFLRADIIGKNDFHGAVYYGELIGEDKTNEYLDLIESKFNYNIINKELVRNYNGMDIVNNIKEYYKVNDINFIKPGIGETTRVLLRRVPWKIIINKKFYDSDELNSIKRLALEKNVNIEMSRVDLGNYKACGIIKNLSDI